MTYSPQNRALPGGPPKATRTLSGSRARTALSALAVTALTTSLLTTSLLAASPVANSAAGPPLASGTTAAGLGTPDLRQAVAGRSPITPAARAEIDRVVGEGLDNSARITAARGTKAASTDVLARALIRCATFEEQRYCLGLGWTQADATQAAGRIASAARSARLLARGATAPETTGDLDAAALLDQRAALTAKQRARVERRELRQAAASIAKIWLLRHQIQGMALPKDFLADHPEVRVPATALGRGGGEVKDPVKTAADYPDQGHVLSEEHVNDQRQTYWCGPTTMQMIAWTKKSPMRTQRYWAKRLRTTTSGTNITDMVRVINNKTDWDKPGRAGTYVVLDISDLTYGQWTLLIRRHIWDYRAPMVFHPILLKEFYPYLDDDASGHYQVGRGYDNNPDGPTKVSFFEPWNQQRFDPSEPFIERVQLRSAYKSYRANQEHFLHNMGV